MKIRLLILLLLTSVCSFAQEKDTLEKRFLLNFVIPDMPAYKSLGVEKSDLLRPSDVKDFAVMISPFYNNGKAVIPKNFGLEFAPWKMASKKWTLEEYEKKAGKRFLYNSSFSLATISDSTEYSAKIAIGYRFALLSDKADVVRIAYSKHSDFAQKAQDARDLKTKLENYWVLQVVSPSPSAAERPQYIDTHQKEFYDWLSTINPQDRTLKDNLKILVFETKRIFGDDFSFAGFKTLKLNDIEEALLDKLILDYKNKNWNANRFDGALAWVAESKDSLIGNARFSSFNAWATGALGIGKKGQLLVGGNIKLPNRAVDSSQKTPLAFTVSARLLVGNSNFRFFGETHWEGINYGSVKNSVLLNIGGEIRISEKFWLVASSGIDNLKDRVTDKWYNQIVANLDLRYGFNF